MTTLFRFPGMIENSMVMAIVTAKKEGKEDQNKIAICPVVWCMYKFFLDHKQW